VCVIKRGSVCVREREGEKEREREREREWRKDKKIKWV
jgi:hypothetical protein